MSITEICLPEADSKMREWLRANIAPVNNSNSDARFEQPVFFSNGVNIFPINIGKSKKMSLPALFNAIVLHETRFDHIQIGNPATRLLKVDRKTLNVTELPVPENR